MKHIDNIEVIEGLEYKIYQLTQQIEIINSLPLPPSKTAKTRADLKEQIYLFERCIEALEYFYISDDY